MTVTGAETPRGRGGPDLRVDVELMRTVAILMVIAVHVTADAVTAAIAAGDRGPAYWLPLIVNEASRAGVPTFLLITGWALLRRDTPRDGAWLRRRTGSLAIPLVAWTVIFVALSIVIGAVRGELPWEAPGIGTWALGVLRSAIFGPGVRGHLWYLYVALALTLAIWLIRTVHTGTSVPRREIVAAALALFVPFGLAEAAGTRMTWGTFGWAIAYAAIGVLVLEMAPRRRLGALMFAGAALVMVVLIDLVGYATWPSARSSPIRMVAGVGLAWLLIGLPANPRLRTAAVRLGALSFGVYLMHPVVLTLLRPPALAVTRAIGFPETALLPILFAAVVVVSFAVVALWHRSARLVRLLG